MIVISQSALNFFAEGNIKIKTYLFQRHKQFCL